MFKLFLESVDSKKHSVGHTGNMGKNQDKVKVPLGCFPEIC